MKTDIVISEILIKISKKNESDPVEAAKIMNAFYKSIYHTITEKEAHIIKVPFFGKFIYSEVYKKKKEEIFLKCKNFTEIIIGR